MKYNYKNVPLNTPVYATAYRIDNETLRAYLKCEPILGEVINLERYEKEIGGNVPRFLRGRTTSDYINGEWKERWVESLSIFSYLTKQTQKLFAKMVFSVIVEDMRTLMKKQ